MRLNVLEEIQSYIDAGELSKWSVPDDIIFVKELPKTSVGKLDKKALRQDFSKHLDLKS